jgi:putative hydrolase of the HAD superfamily
MDATERRTDLKTQLGQIKIIAFDADDTLWVNETYFREAEAYFCELLDEYASAERVNQVLYETETGNLPLYGYGIKPFTLSLIEAALKITDGNLPIETVDKLIVAGKQMLEKPVILLPGIEDSLATMSQKYRLVMATKGDLVDQERKLSKSGLGKYFHHIEIVSDKTSAQYLKLANHLDIAPHEFLMIGNSPKSDILPVLEIGAFAFHVPFHTTWEHEVYDQEINHPRFKSFETAADILAYLA